MAPTKETIKSWLDAHPERDRHWLAEKCEVEKRTVDNWLSSPQNIPAKALRIIESLMRADAEIERAKNPAPPMTLVLEVEPERFDAYNHAATAHGQIIREWAVSVLNKAAERDSKGAQEVAPDKITPISRRDEVSQAAPAAHVMAAAGSPIGAEVIDWNGGSDTISVRISGLSMDPLFADGDVIRVKLKHACRSPHMAKGSIYLVQYDGGLTVKRFNTRVATKEEIEAGITYISPQDKKAKVRVLQSLNKDFPEIVIKDEADWIGWYDPKDNE